MTHAPSSFRRTRPVLSRGAHSALWTTLACGLGASAFAQQNQVLFSVDYHGPTKSRPDSATGTPISEGDVLAIAPAPVFGPFPAPRTVFNGGQVGIFTYPTCLPTLPGQPCGAELDALSLGNDRRFQPPGPSVEQPRVYYSVDRFAQGNPASVGAPSVRTEGPQRDAAADIYTPVFPLVPPVPPLGTAPSSILVKDGNGRPSSTGAMSPGIGLFEPHSPQPAPAADVGDNIDALHLGPVPGGPSAAIYFSLDAGFPDPNGVPNSNSAQLNGMSPSAVMRTPISGGSAQLYASPQQLGLNPFLDDLDALALAENGVPGYQPSLNPYDWGGGIVTGTDMLLFSVRRGSVLIQSGALDSNFGVRIVPGDILTTPIAGGNGNPAIFIAADALGLAVNRPMGLSDELDAIAIEYSPIHDCNNNGVEDAVDIAQGQSSDSNNNGIPDECEQSYSRYCTCTAALAPCGNTSATTGCLNSTGSGGALDGLGTTSVATDDLEIVASGLPPNVANLLFAGPNPTAVTFGDGVRCVAGPTFRVSLQNATPAGDSNFGPALLNDLCTTYSQCLGIGSTYHYQVWYRNAAAYCTAATHNLTNGLVVTYTP